MGTFLNRKTTLLHIIYPLFLKISPLIDWLSEERQTRDFQKSSSLYTTIKLSILGVQSFSLFQGVLERFYITLAQDKISSKIEIMQDIY